MEQKKFVWDSKMKHKVELMIILLIITVIGNITVYYFNHRYENSGKYAKSEEIVPTLTVTPQPTEPPVASTGAILRDCELYKTQTYTLCLPKTWLAIPNNANETRFQPKSIPTGIPHNTYLYIFVTDNQMNPLPTPVRHYTALKPYIVGTTTGYRSEYIPQKTADGFVLPITPGCQDPIKILVPAGKKTLDISSCKQNEEIIKPILDSILITP